MDIEQILMMVAGKSPLVLMLLGILGSLVVVGQAVVVLTPSKADDEAWAKLHAIPVLGSVLSAVAKFGVIQKK